MHGDPGAISFAREDTEAQAGGMTSLQGDPAVSHRVDPQSRSGSAEGKLPGHAAGRLERLDRPTAHSRGWTAIQLEKGQKSWHLLQHQRGSRT